MPLSLLCPLPDAVVITHPPQNQTICEGDNVTITCGFTDSDITPNWIIGNLTLGRLEIMFDNRLYVPDVNDTNDTVLIMLSINAAMNGTTTQCEIPTRVVLFSSVGVLTVMGEASTMSICIIWRYR